MRVLDELSTALYDEHVRLSSRMKRFAMPALQADEAGIGNRKLRRNFRCLTHTVSI